MSRNTTQLDWKALKPSSLSFPFVSGWRHALPSKFSCAMHRHSAVEMVYHRQGSGVTRLGSGEEVRFGVDSCVLYAPGLLHDQVMDTAGEDLCVHVAVPERMAKRLIGCLIIERAGRFGIEDWDRLTSGRWVSEQCEKAIQDLRVTALLLTMVRGSSLLLEKENNAAEIKIQRTEDYIREHYADIETLGQVAAKVGLSHDRLRHLFQQQRGTSLVSYLAKVRVERAKSLLVYSTLPLKQVAGMCGFRDEYYFSAVFRKQVGTPPGIFRKSGKGQTNEHSNRVLI